MELKVNGKVVAAPTGVPTGWFQPPGTLARAVVDPVNKPLGYQTKWIAFNNQPAAQLPTPWSVTYTSSLLRTAYRILPPPQLLQPQTFVWFQQLDNECPAPPACQNYYFCTQLVVRQDPNDLLWGNLQAESR